MILYPYFFNYNKLSCKIGLSYIFVFIAGDINLGPLKTNNVAISLSSQIIDAILPIIFADAGATINISSFLANDTCSTLNSKFLSNVSTKHLLPVNVSNLIRLIKLHAFFMLDG